MAGQSGESTVKPVVTHFWAATQKVAQNNQLSNIHNPNHEFDRKRILAKNYPRAPAFICLHPRMNSFFEPRRSFQVGQVLNRRCTPLHADVFMRPDHCGLDLTSLTILAAAHANPGDRLSK
jgi:hypothetical protein